MAIDDPIQRGTPEGNSQSSAKTKMGQKMALVHQRLSLLDNGGRHVDDGDDDFELTDEELAIVVGQQSKAAAACAHPDGEVDYVPLRIMRPNGVDRQEKHPGSRYKHGAKKTTTYFTKTYKRKRVRPEGSKSAKSKMEQKLALVDSSSRGSSDSKRGKDDDLEPSDKDDDFEPMRKRGRRVGSRSSKSKKRPLVYRNSSEGKKDNDDDFEPEVSDDDDQKKYARVKDFYGNAWDRAVKLNEKLPADGPSFAKLMLKSHVVRGFWLGLPVSFCRNYLPEHDVKIELEDVEGRIYDTNYLDNKKGLSGGWNGFAQQHDLNVGDAVVFQLVGPTRFKVYILRDNRFSTTDGALTLLSLDTSKENNISEGCSSDNDVKSKEDPEEVTGVGSKAFHDDEVADGDDIRSPDPDTDFGTVKNLRNFKIIVDGSVIDRKLFPARTRTAYYELCCARKAFLHRHLLKHINPTLAAGVIVETVNIADGIRASHASCSSLEDLTAWKKTLESFEILGMDVAFMRKRVDDLLALLNPRSPSRDLLQDGVEECERYEEVKQERDRVAEKMRALESRMSSLKDALEEMGMEMKEMAELSAMKKKDQAMRRLAAEPW